MKIQIDNKEYDLPVEIIDIINERNEFRAVTGVQTPAEALLYLRSIQNIINKLLNAQNREIEDLKYIIGKTTFI